jgi:hypothetical protein
MDDQVEELRAEVESLRGDVRTLAAIVEDLTAQQIRLAEALQTIAGEAAALARAAVGPGPQSPPPTRPPMVN